MIGVFDSGLGGLSVLSAIARQQPHSPLCYVADTVESLILLTRTPAARGEIFNIGGTEEVSIAALAELVIATLGSKSRLQLVPYNEAYAPGFEDMRRRKPNVTKLERITGFKPASTLREIITRTANG